MAVASVRGPGGRRRWAEAIALPAIGVAAVLAAFEVAPRVGRSPLGLPPVPAGSSPPWSISSRPPPCGRPCSTRSTPGPGDGIATVIAVPLGLAIGASRVGALLSRPVVDFLRPIPSVALIPILILARHQPAVKVTLAAFRATFRCCMPGHAARRRRSPWPRTPAARPSACRSAPAADRSAGLRAYLATGLRISASVALILMVTGEYIVGVGGIGREVFLHPGNGAAEERLDPGGRPARPNLCFHAVERRVLFWHPDQRADEAGGRRSPLVAEPAWRSSSCCPPR